MIFMIFYDIYNIIKNIIKNMYIITNISRKNKY